MGFAPLCDWDTSQDVCRRSVNNFFIVFWVFFLFSFSLSLFLGGSMPFVPLSECVCVTDG